MSNPSARISRIMCAVIGLGVLALALPPKPIAAQEPPAIQQIAVQVHDGGFSLYSVDGAGQFSLITTFTSFNLAFLSYAAESEWEIASPADFVASPDGRRIAFTATTVAGQAALFLYTQGEPDPRQVAAPGTGTLHWAPTSDALVLAPPEVPSGFHPYVTDVHLYSLESDSFINLTHTPQEAEEAVIWLPDGDHILYTGPVNTCGDVPCLNHRDWYVFDRATHTQTELVDLGPQLPADIPGPSDYCHPHVPVWSALEQRLYYAVSCNAAFGKWNSLLYSVDLQGDNRLEMDLPALYPANYDTVIHALYAHSDSGHLYLLVGASFNEVINNRLQEAGRWQVFSNRSGQWEMVIQPATPAPRGGALAVSPDEQRIAVGGQTMPGEGFLALADLATGQVVTEVKETTVWEVQWRDDQTLLYLLWTGCTTGCAADAATWALDTATGHSEQVTGGLDGIMWLRPASLTAAATEN